MNLIEVKRRLTGGDLTVLDEIPPEEREVLRHALLGLQENDVRPAYAAMSYDRDDIPVGIDEYIESSNYLGMGEVFYPAWREELRYVLDPTNEISLWVIKGAIRTGKSFVAAAAVSYKAYDLTCWTDPAAQFGLASGTSLVIGLLNAYKYLAEDVNYHDLSKFFSACPYFRTVREQIKKADRENKVKGNTLNLPKGIRVITGSDEFHMLGRAMPVGIMDEAAWRDRRLDPEKEEALYKTVVSLTRRIKGSVGDSAGRTAGLMIIVSSEREMSSITARVIEEFGDDPHTHVTSFATWDVKPQPGDENKFYVAIPSGGGVLPRMFKDEAEASTFAGESGSILSVPLRFWGDFDRDILGALNDIAGVRAGTGSMKFFYLPDRIEACVDPSRENPWADETIVHGMSSPEPLSDYFKLSSMSRLYDVASNVYRPLHFPSSPRVLHMDLAINHDAAGLLSACAGAPVVREQATARRLLTLPEFTLHVDFAVRIVAPPGSRIHFEALRQFVLWYNQFAGVPIALLSWDGFESEDNTQIMEKRGFKTTKLSVDRTLAPYSTLRDVLLAKRASYPRLPYMMAELKALEKWRTRGRRTEAVDHPKRMTLGTRVVPASKDMADPLAACCYHVMVTLPSAPALGDPSRLYPPVPLSEIDPASDIMTGMLKRPGQSFADLVLGNPEGRQTYGQPPIRRR